MKEFNCISIDENGIKHKDRILAENTEHAITIIEEKKLIPLKIRQIVKISCIKKNNSMEMLEYLKLLQQLLESGLTVSECLGIINKMKGTKKNVRIISGKILSEIEKGVSYSESMKKCHEFFSQVCISMSQIGDKSGNLDVIMKHLVQYVENKIRLKERIRGSLLYPCAVLFSAIIMLAVSVAFVFPCLEDVLNAFSAEASYTFKGKIKFVKTVAIFIMAASTFIFLAAIYFFNSNNKRLQSLRDNILLRIPAIGKIILLSDSISLAFSMESMQSNNSFTAGYVLEESIKTIKNKVLKEDVNQIRKMVISGKSLSDSFSSSKWFSENFSKWISVGEKNGHSEKTFRHIRKSLETDMERLLKTSMEVIEPAITLFTGLMILASVFAFIIPVFEAMGNL